MERGGLVEIGVARETSRPFSKRRWAPVKRAAIPSWSWSWPRYQVPTLRTIDVPSYSTPTNPVTGIANRDTVGGHESDLRTEVNHRTGIECEALTLTDHRQ